MTEMLLMMRDGSHADIESARQILLELMVAGVPPAGASIRLACTSIFAPDPEVTPENLDHLLPPGVWPPAMPPAHFAVTSMSQVAWELAIPRHIGDLGDFISATPGNFGPFVRIWPTNVAEVQLIPPMQILSQPELGALLEAWHGLYPSVDFERWRGAQIYKEMAPFDPSPEMPTLGPSEPSSHD